MKNIILISFVLIAVFATSCKKATLTKKMNDSTWQLKQIQSGSDDVTSDVLKTEVIYTNLRYSNDGNNIVFSNPNSENVAAEEEGSWELEKIVPTVGNSYYLIRNSISYSYERRKLFNVSEYGSEVILTEDNLLTQTKGDYTITYEKIN
jgi:hypothetical protein